MSDTPKQIDQLMFDAIQAHSMRTRGQPAQRITVEYPDGSQTTYPMPPRPLDGSPIIVDLRWPPPDGWAFRPGECAFNGVVVKLCGKLLAMLRVLAEHPGEPVTGDSLKRVVWGEEPDLVEDGNLQGHVSILRRKLRQGLSLSPEVNPITHADGAYRLALH